MKLRIGLYVPIYDQTGGGEVFTGRLADQLVRRGYPVTILTSQPMSRWRKGGVILEHKGLLRVLRLPVWQHSGQTFTLMWQIEASFVMPIFLRNFNVLLINMLSDLSIYMGRMAHRLGIKTVCRPWASGPYGDVASFPRQGRREASAFDWLTALTEHIREEAIAWGFPQARTGIIPNGVDVEFFRPSTQPTDPHGVIFVGALRPEKRIHLLLEAFRLAQDRFSDAHLTLLGAKDDNEYQGFARKLNLAVEFIPVSTPEVVLARLQQNSIFVMSGVSEGMSNALLEGMSVGLAPVVSDTPGNRAVIQPGINGLCYPPDSAEALAESLCLLMKDGAQRARLGAEARNTVLRSHTLEQVTDLYLALFERVLRESRNARIGGVQT